MTSGTTPSEQFVFKVCTSTFLSLWSYANPQGRQPGRELCDILVVCHPDVVIFSVKDVKLTEHRDVTIVWDRWLRSAIESSSRQIYGAERWLNQATRVIQSDGSQGLDLPPINNRRTHRVAVAVGSQREAPLQYGDFGKGFVHVFDEITFPLVLKELDTIEDFVGYLDAKERFTGGGTETIFEGREEDFLAMYLANGRTLPSRFDRVLIMGGIWDDFVSRPEYRAKQIADEPSYLWDGIIETISKYDLADNLIPGSATMSQAEIMLRAMSRESRFNRRLLGGAFKEFLDQSLNGNVRARLLRSPSNVAYVFLATPHGHDREERRAELQMRVWVARSLKPTSHTVIGIATEQYERDRGFSLDAVYLHQESWTKADQEEANRLQAEYEFFTNMKTSSISEDEYPTQHAQ